MHLIPSFVRALQYLRLGLWQLPWVPGVIWRPVWLCHHCVAHCCGSSSGLEACLVVSSLRGTLLWVILRFLFIGCVITAWHTAVGHPQVSLQHLSLQSLCSASCSLLASTSMWKMTTLTIQMMMSSSGHQSSQRTWSRSSRQVVISLRR